MKLSKLALSMAMIATVSLGALQSATAADYKDRTIKVSHVVPKDHPFQIGIEKYAEILAAKTDGKMKMRGYPDGQLGAELASITSAQAGVLEMALVSTAATASVVKEFGVFDLPMMFNDAREVDHILDGPIGQAQLDKLTDKGLIGLCFFETGFRHLTNSRRSVAKLEDFKGLKIRTIQSSVFIDVFNTLGANATPLAFTEVFNALESKAIDGQETPYSNIYGNKFYEVQKYLSNTAHIYGGAVIMVSKKFWDQLTADEQKVMRDSCAPARDHERKYSRDNDPKLLQELKNKGMIYTEVAPAERQRIRDALKPVYQKYAKNLGEDVVNQTMNELEKFRANKPK